MSETIVVVSVDVPRSHDSLVGDGDASAFYSVRDLLLYPVLLEGLPQSSHGFLSLDGETASSDRCRGSAEQRARCGIGDGDHRGVIFFFFFFSFV